MAAACVYNVPPRPSYVNIREIRCPGKFSVSSQQYAAAYKWTDKILSDMSATIQDNCIVTMGR